MLLLNLVQGGKSKNLIKWILPAVYRQGIGKFNTYFGGVFTREQITTGTRVTVLFRLVVGGRICQSRQGQCKRWWII